MGEEYNPVRNICSQTKRFRTATVKAKILNTERLSNIGLDMSELRCKDLANFQCCIGSRPLNSKGFEDRSTRNHVGRFSNVVSLTTSNHKASRVREITREISQHFLANDSSKKFASRFPNFQTKITQISNIDTDIEEKSERSSDGTTNSHRINKSTWKLNKDFNDTPSDSQSNLNGWLYFVECSTDIPMTKFAKKKEIAPRELFQKCEICGNSFGTAGFKIHQPRCSQTKITDASQQMDIPKNTRFRGQVQYQMKELSTAINTNSNCKKQEKDKISESQTKFKQIVCDICNRQFGSHSISIHRPQCLKKINQKIPPTGQLKN
ncbi:uncharacterized protein LOC124196632 isoform X2 [Daphnia pulex]|uniref:uncharacterized protein LOC124196632 isoform X2 n=1 Tax=Daphnia pulex TaxID=6669 RepID=UPI001EE0647D|nr:uncharacterized protein LOC124196632 isoform X2 [Daphnia pulex]